jgi:hypothetical protein
LNRWVLMRAAAKAERTLCVSGRSLSNVYARMPAVIEYKRIHDILLAHCRAATNLLPTVDGITSHGDGADRRRACAHDQWQRMSSTHHIVR